MKIQSWMVISGLLLCPALASAETILGTVTTVDPMARTVTVLRTDNNQKVTIHVKDTNQLAEIKAGTQINVNAHKKMLGGWEAKSLDASSGPVTPAPGNIIGPGGSMDAPPAAADASVTADATVDPQEGAFSGSRS